MKILCTTTCLFLSLLLVLLAAACNSRQARDVRRTSEQASTHESNPVLRSLDNSSYCVQNITQGPPSATPIHFSYKKDSTDGSSTDYEADLAGDTFDVTIHNRRPATDIDRQVNGVPGAKPVSIHDGFAESLQTNHYNRSDDRGWVLAGNGVVLGVTPWQLFVTKPTVTQAGSENVIGYETTKYTVDTRQQSSIDKFAGSNGWNVKDYNITGTVWVTKDTACILEYTIDLEKIGKDDKVSETHYQGIMTKR